MATWSTFPGHQRHDDGRGMSHTVSEPRTYCAVSARWRAGRGPYIPPHGQHVRSGVRKERHDAGWACTKGSIPRWARPILPLIPLYRSRASRTSMCCASTCRTQCLLLYYPGGREVPDHRRHGYRVSEREDRDGRAGRLSRTCRGSRFFWSTGCENAAWPNGEAFYDIAQWLIIAGASTGLNLDGGGSTAMACRDSNNNPILMNVPYGAESFPGVRRAVGNFFGVITQPQPQPLS
ncbi:phosphodiester glycosidase family protein [Streptomyces lydicus]|uniref:phosphodiester glycosidase family protein n=1 Tax=Streptomyces lydicus TaxID=47763 RepID=UPI00372105CF